MMGQVIRQRDQNTLHDGVPKIDEPFPNGKVNCLTGLDDYNNVDGTSCVAKAGVDFPTVLCYIRAFLFTQTFLKFVSHQKESYYFRVSNKIYL